MESSVKGTPVPPFVVQPPPSPQVFSHIIQLDSMPNPYQSPSAVNGNAPERSASNIDRRQYVPVLLLLSSFLAVVFGVSTYSGLSFDARYSEYVPEYVSTIRNLIAGLLCIVTIVLALVRRTVLAWKIFAVTVVCAVGSALVIMLVNMV